MPAAPSDSPAERRAFVVVIDALGAGAEPDAADYGDAGANTLLHLAERCGGLQLPALEHLGLGNILPLPGVAPSPAPVLHGRLAHQGPGKDSTTGHWELMGVVTETPLPTYPDGVPAPIVARIEAAMGRPTCGGGVMDGLAAIAELAPRHLRTGELILYTSVDSVLQLAGHGDVLSEAELIAACAAARAELAGPDAVGRVIARPFTGPAGAFERTDGRRDFAVPPPGRSHLDALHDRGVAVHAVGKVGDLFTGRGIDEAHPGATNAQALASLDALVDGMGHGLAMANLVETDQLYGHRKDVAGFHRALREIDAAVGGWLHRLRPGDLLVITADHGVDPALAHYDHTREQVPLLAAFPAVRHGRHDGAMADVGASALRWLTGEDEPALPGAAFL
ncbi:MAG TPA: phosphopentomutase [Solirubrobacteraceae bacterium]